MVKGFANDPVAFIWLRTLARNRIVSRDTEFSQVDLQFYPGNAIKAVLKLMKE